MMDHSYSLGLEARDLSARSMRVVKQERNMLDRDEKPRKQRKRALVACNRCRKRKIKCNGDLNTGLACTSCRTVGATECQYSRVNSLSPEEAARCFGANKRSTLGSMGSPQARAPFQREEYEMDSQSSFSRQNVSMDSLNYDDQSSTYQPSNYLLSNNPDYQWNSRWDPNLRPATSEFFEEPMPQAYNFVLPQAQLPVQAPIPTNPETTYPELDRTLPTPTSHPETHTGQTQSQPQPDPKAFWSRYPERMPYQQPTPLKFNDPDLVYSYMPIATTDDPVSQIPAPAPPSTYQVLDPEINCVDRRYRDSQRLLVRSSDCTPDVYGYSSGRKTERATLMNGLPYTRVRPADSYAFLPDSLSEFGCMEGLHRPPILPLGHQGAY